MMTVATSSAEGLVNPADGREERKKKAEPRVMLMEPKTPSVMSNNDDMSSSKSILREDSKSNDPVGDLMVEEPALEQFGGSCDEVVIPCEESLLACGLTAEELADLEMHVFSNDTKSDMI